MTVAIFRFLAKIPLMGLVGALGAASAFAQAPPGMDGPPGPSGPMTVGVVTLERSAVPYTVTLPGRAVAYEQVDIRPRVEGVIAEIPYELGSRVSVGDPLFKIEDDTYTLEVDAAEAAVVSAEAELAAAQVVYDRNKPLSGKAVARSTVADYEVAVKQAKASLSTAQASLKAARLNLERTVVRSPIDGIPDVPTVSVGAVVTANQTDALTTVTRLDPIYVDLEESAARIQRLRAMQDRGELKFNSDLDMRLWLETGEMYAEVGKLLSPGVLVSTTTGTTELRVRFANPERRILPGQFLRVDATLGTTEAILLPQLAAQREAGGELVAYVARDGKAVRVVLGERGVYENAWVVTNGVKSGDRLIVDGLLSLKNGDAVQTVPAEITADGLVRDIGSGAGESAASPAPSSSPVTE
ncbi:MAG: efflux RND transporter periplasmic adaptor subunit [Rhodospirillum sp.]|nr:efflux RND transporter periplasmic adaptor subunit [Rhodospirillum sp.]MCF8489898.1 efflux RND transporter periplasmic adaptor subunit [Rhodospirillum sp.]MCF8502964.1 efflux RND transporter periplasmic adaptor subunit [Rhodospirillum sp.]